MKLISKRDWKRGEQNIYTAGSKMDGSVRGGVSSKTLSISLVPADQIFQTLYRNIYRNIPTWQGNPLRTGESWRLP